jgi:hypothetical protein
VQAVFSHKFNIKKHEHECKIEQRIYIWGFLEHHQHNDALFNGVNTIDDSNYNPRHHLRRLDPAAVELVDVLLLAMLQFVVSHKVLTQQSKTFNNLFIVYCSWAQHHNFLLTPELPRP